MRVNTLGHELLEKPYENALAVEFGLRNVPFRQPRKLSGLSWIRRWSTELLITNVDWRWIIFESRSCLSELSLISSTQSWS